MSFLQNFAGVSVIDSKDEKIIFMGFLFSQTVKTVLLENVLIFSQ